MGDCKLLRVRSEMVESDEVKPETWVVVAGRPPLSGELAGLVTDGTAGPAVDLLVLVLTETATSDGLSSL